MILTKILYHDTLRYIWEIPQHDGSRISKEMWRSAYTKCIEYGTPREKQTMLTRKYVGVSLHNNKLWDGGQIT